MMNFKEKHLQEDEIYQMMVMEPVSLKEIDQENSSFFDSDNFRELSSEESFGKFEDEKSSSEGSRKGRRVSKSSGNKRED
jgi:hypothetical protein